MEKIIVPILLVGFNRADLIEKNLSNILAVNPEKIYISIDGPRLNRPNDIPAIGKVRNIIDNLNIQCELHTVFHEENLTCRGNVTSAISWVLQHEPYVIVLEDDVIAPPSFFHFMQEMLIKYEKQEKIAMVSGCNYTPIAFPNDEDYCFAQTGHIWGWATWKRVWDKFDVNDNFSEKIKSLEYIESISPSKKIAKYRYKLLHDYLNGEQDTWALKFYFFHLLNNYLCIIPKSHLTSNIGIEGAHTGGVTKYHFLKCDNEFVVKKHPNTISWYKDYDINEYRIRCDRSPLSVMLNRIKVLLKIIFK